MGGVTPRASVLADRERELELGERMLLETQRLAHIGSWEWDVQANRVTWSDELYRIYGAAPRAFEPTFETYLERVHPEDRDRVCSIVQGALAAPGPFSFEERIVRPDGTIRYLRSEGRVIAGSDGEVERLVGVCHDITDRRRAEQGLEAAQRRFEMAFRHAPIAKTLVEFRDGKAHLIDVNPAFCALLGRSAEQLLGMDIEDITHPEDRNASTNLLENLLSTERPSAQLQKRYMRPDGEVVWAQLHATLVTDNDGRPAYAVTQIVDVTARREAEEQLAHQALHDVLTGLPNRALIMDRLTQGLGRAARQNTMVAAIFLDLDNFKLINDSLGHVVGDELLRAVGVRLDGMLRPSDTVGRFGGDEFVLVCEDLADARDAVVIAARIAEAFEEPFSFAGRKQHITASLGVAVASDRYATGESLIRDADVAMYRAKETGRNRFELFDAAMRERVVQRLAAETDLRRALSEGELRVFYQPVVRVDGDLVAVEALARWEHPERGLLGPAEFISLAEETGLIFQLGEQILEEACRQTAEWRRDGKDIAVSVNLSARQLTTPDTVELVRSVLKRSGLPAPALCVEITEGGVMHHADEAMRTLQSLRKLGVRIAIDDFGVGYSSLSYLKTLPVDVVKLDRAFVQSLPDSKEDKAIVSAVLALADVMGLTVIAEGVESKRHLAELRRLGCQLVQGYLFGRPQLPHELDLDGLLPAGRPGVGDPLVIREFMRQIGIPARRTT
jgi:diguanylate cyclase (GGDEF)-like protein/PAS domain S-box-containing protein